MRRGIRALIFGVLAMGLVVGNAGATDLEPLQLVEDPALDHDFFEQIAAETTPPWMDLKAAYIAETRDTIDFIWEYYEIPDGSGGPFEGNISYYEFGLDDNDGVTDPVLFSLRVRLTYPANLGVHVHCSVPGLPVFSTCTGVGPGGGSLSSNCGSGTVVTCRVVPGSLVTVSVDEVKNTVTAKVRRLDLRDADNNFIGTDGSVLTEADLFHGIAACPSLVVLGFGFCDEADMNVNVDDETGGYFLGSPRA